MQLNHESLLLEKLSSPPPSQTGIPYALLILVEAAV